MKKFLLFPFGIALLLFGVIFMGIGGINQLVDGLNSDPNDWSDIVWGVVRILLTPATCAWGAIITIIGGIFLVDSRF